MPGSRPDHKEREKCRKSPIMNQGSTQCCVGGLLNFKCNKKPYLDEKKDMGKKYRMYKEISLFLF